MSASREKSGGVTRRFLSAHGLDKGTFGFVEFDRGEVMVLAIKVRGGCVHVLGRGKARSKGVRGEVVVQGDEAAKELRRALAEAEQSSGLRLRRAILCVSGRHVASEEHSAAVRPTGRGGRFTRLDVKTARVLSQAGKLAEGRCGLHYTEAIAEVDGERIEGRVVGRRGKLLRLRTWWVQADARYVTERIELLRRCGLEVHQVIGCCLGGGDLCGAHVGAQCGAGCVVADLKSCRMVGGDGQRQVGKLVTGEEARDGGS